MNKKFYTLILVTALFFSNLTLNLKAAIGDTINVQAHNAAHMNYYGNFDAWAVCPPSNMQIGKILMKYTLGCPATGCSQWDYTTQVFTRKHTGTYDSTLVLSPSFTVNGTIEDPFYYNMNPVYIYFYNTTTQTTDSSIATLLNVFIYGDSLNPVTATDSMQVYPGNFYNYIFNTGGTIADSVFVSADSLWNVAYYSDYTYQEIIENFELGRVMTPYAGNYPTSWTREFWFDVTDYRSLLTDSADFRVFYDGYSDGFTATTDFYFIEGNPPRNVKRVRNIYPEDYYQYGITTNPIENRLVAKTIDIAADEYMAKIRVIPSGHSFGGPQNCAEFCQKNYRFTLDGIQRVQQLVWRTDCGLNPLMAQGGTWIYDRSNWCPGEKSIVRSHEITSWITPGDSLILDMNFDTYTYTSGANFPPGYYLSTALITYDTINYAVNAAMDDIISPSTNFQYSRLNPICNNPVVVIKNNGSQALTSADIHFGIKGGLQQVFNWTGNLAFDQTETVILGQLAWGSAGNTPDQFEVYISNPNGTADQYAYNDTMRSTLTFTPLYPAQFKLLWKTNNASNETTYQLKDDLGSVLYSNQIGLTANTIYNDTFNLAPGCYELKISDSGKDGLSFFANNDGTGYARLVKTDGSNAIIKTFTADFGTAIYARFTVGFTTGVEEKITDAVFQIAPNPNNGRFTLNLILPKADNVEIVISNQIGQVVYREMKNGFVQDLIDINLNDQSAGMYFVSVKTSNGIMTKKVVLE
ncbi:hypothetical protein BH11BAC2_BH11BAC2_11880 [soil metagenome]